MRLAAKAVRLSLRSMHRLFLKIPWWIRLLFPSYLWRVPAAENVVYLTFDDGPHPDITPWVLEQLKQYNAKATFFCIGKNVLAYPETYQCILAEGHAVGNHTFSHPNGWHTATDAYVDDTKKAAAIIDSSLFRPPYGRIKKNQARKLPGATGKKNVKVVMWDVLSADFDASITPEQCAGNVLKRAERGSIIVFHDSEKAFRNLQFALPEVLKKLEIGGFTFGKLEH